jgi:hypothetical protein
MSQPKKLNYEKLKEKWYAKLKKEGFEDIESDENNLKVYASTLFNKHKSAIQNGGWQAKASYYSMAERFLNEYVFDTNLDKVIWEYHTNAISVRNIVHLLKKVKVAMKKDTVWNTVKRLEIEMKKAYLEGYNGK